VSRPTVHEAAGVPAEVVAHKGLPRAVFEAQLHDALARHGIEAVVLAGFSGFALLIAGVADCRGAELDQDR